ncbi:HD domain-containing protein [Nocardioides ungokensis]|uniref:HD domain-containing protein n=1 Tax=Nocardioides ungokensis TaxID=1643322 RepID=UPI0015DE2463|nr:HD domain-containing protein [Nocardioides ungokensis]
MDRHVVETCIEASALIRSVARPDVLMVAALLHDIGKGSLTEHSVAGEPLARAIAARMGFDADAVDLVGTLVRRHLLLAETATTRDPDDPATVELVTSAIGSPEALSLLTALTEADARATSAKAWTRWRAGLVLDLARRAAAALDAGRTPARVVTDDVTVPPEARAGGLAVAVEAAPDGSRVTLVAPDRVGLLADEAAVFALQRYRCGPPARGRRSTTASPCGRSPGRTSRRPCSGSGTTRWSTAGSTPPDGCGPRTPTHWSRRSPYAPRPRRTRPCWRSGPPTAPGSSTSSAPRSRGSGSRCARPTSTRSGRRRSTCSTCRRTRRGCSGTTAPRGRPRRPRRPLGL